MTVFHWFVRQRNLYQLFNESEQESGEPPYNFRKDFDLNLFNFFSDVGPMWPMVLADRWDVNFESSWELNKIDFLQHRMICMAPLHYIRNWNEKQRIFKH